MSDEGGEASRIDLKHIRKNREALEPIISDEQARGEEVVAWLVNSFPDPQLPEDLLARVLERIDQEPPTSK